MPRGSDGKIDLNAPPRRLPDGHIDAIEVTIDDPKAYTRPWTVNLSWTLQPDTDRIESICEENNKAAHLPAVRQ